MRKRRGQEEGCRELLDHMPDRRQQPQQGRNSCDRAGYSVATEPQYDQRSGRFDDAQRRRGFADTVSFSITSITDDQVAHDDAGGHGCGTKTSKQGLDWRPIDFDDNNPLTISGNLEKMSESIATEPGVVQLRSERCAADGSRVYELEITCCDNTHPEAPVCDAEPEVLQVTVPRDRRQVQHGVNE